MKTSRRNRIIPIIVVLAIVATIVVSFMSVFVVRDVVIACYDQEGQPIAVADETNIGIDVMTKFYGSHIMTLDKNLVVEYVNTNYPTLHALEVVKQFPNQLAVHIVKREAVYTVTRDAELIYIDSFGYVVEAPLSDHKLFDITDSFVTPAKEFIVGSPLKFGDENDNNRLSMILQTINMIWRLKYSYSDVAWLIDTIKFSSDNGTMIISTMQQATINVAKPTANLEDRLIDAFSVYYNTENDLQNSDSVINVAENGKITTN